MEKVLKFKFSLIIALLLFTTSVYSQIRINEVCASNAESLYDEDSDTPDWIELYNYSNEPVNLNNWKISDKNNYEKAWQFPDTTMQPNSYLIVFASGKNRFTKNKFSMNVRSEGSIVSFNNRDAYRFRYTKVSGDFEAYLDVNSMRNEGLWSHCGLIAREKLNDTTNFYSIIASSREKDGFINYKREHILESPNWTPIYGALNMPFTKLYLSRKDDTLSCAYIDRGGNLINQIKYPNFLPNEVYLGVSVAGFNKNEFATFIIDSLIINEKYTDISKLDVFEVNTNETGYDLQYNEMHTNFTIKDDETVYLYKSSVIVDSVKLQTMTGDVTNIFTVNNIWQITDVPTPGKKNGRGFIARLPKPEISFDGNKVKIVDTNNAIIRITTNCSMPNQNSEIYDKNKPINISKTTTIKAVAYKENYLPSFVSTNIYFINEPETTLPIVAISADSNDLWGEYGIINHLVPNKINANINFYKNAKNLLNKNIKIKIHGQATVYLPEKSFRVYAGYQTEDNYIKNIFFEKSELKKYKQIVLRNSGQDWTSLLLRDSYSAIISSNLRNQIYASYQPAFLYLNSEFYGITNIRERIEDDYIADKYNVNDKYINMFKNNGINENGDYFEYKNFIYKIKTSNFKNNYIIIDSIMDISNFIDYIILYVYNVNNDWPALNVKCFNSNELDGKFRYITNDLDISLGFNSSKADYNKIEQLLADTTNDLPIIFQKFIKNERFKKEFLTRACDLVNSVFRTENMVHILDSLADQIRPYIPLQQQRWEGSCVNWEEKLDGMRFFLKERPMYFMKNINYYLNDDIGTSEFTLSTYPPNSGTFKVNTISVDTSVWNGRYFQTLPITITAIPKFGKKFVSWNYDSLGTNPTITTTLPSSYSLEAIYEDIDPTEQDKFIVINEIMYNADKNTDTKDWIELYNAGKKEVNLNGWSLIDEDTTHTIFKIEQDYTIKPDEYVIVTKDSGAFKEYIKIDNKIFGNLEFGLGGNDIIVLKDAEGKLQDSVNYDNDLPWPIGADGTGNTIELINPGLDNNIGQNWLISKDLLGTPGKKNSNYNPNITSVELQRKNSNLKISQIDNQLTIKSDDLISKIEIYSIEGRKISEYNTNYFSEVIDLDGYQKGVYICTVITKNRVETLKILLN